jgi:hypothetical protein
MGGRPVERYGPEGSSGRAVAVVLLGAERLCLSAPHVKQNVPVHLENVRRSVTISFQCSITSDLVITGSMARLSPRSACRGAASASPLASRVPASVSMPRREYVHAGRRGLYYRAFGPRVATSGGALLAIAAFALHQVGSFTVRV